MDASRDLPGNAGPTGGVVIPFAAGARRRSCDDQRRAVSAEEVTFRRETGCRIRVSRMSGGLSQVELSRATGLTTVAIRRLEDGVVPIDAWHLNLIADALNVTMSGLAGRRDGW